MHCPVGRAAKPQGSRRMPGLAQSRPGASTSQGTSQTPTSRLPGGPPVVEQTAGPSCLGVGPSREVIDAAGSGRARLPDPQSPPQSATGLPRLGIERPDCGPAARLPYHPVAPGYRGAATQPGGHRGGHTASGWQGPTWRTSWNTVRGSPVVHADETAWMDTTAKCGTPATRGKAVGGFGRRFRRFWSATFTPPTTTMRVPNIAAGPTSCGTSIDLDHSTQMMDRCPSGLTPSTNSTVRPLHPADNNAAPPKWPWKDIAGPLPALPG